MPSNATHSSASVLIVTGGFISGKELRFWSLLKRQMLQFLCGRQAWLDIKIKLNFFESMVMRRRLKPKVGTDVATFLESKSITNIPELTEVVLGTILKQSGIEYEAVSIDALFDEPTARKALLGRHRVVFLSTTFLRDISELAPVLRVLKEGDNRIVLGGPLAALMPDELACLPEVDLLAIGYGEYLVPEIAEWIKSDFKSLSSPARGRIVTSGKVQLLYSGAPASRHLDDLVTPDWSLVQSNEKPLQLIHYESVRGCPYRCEFCNYPYLFDDTAFRYKTAEKVADDWERYVNELGVSYINCLDSLFTAPRHRLEKFCNLLIQRNIKVKWICYARASDLKNQDTVALMQEAGLWQVQIGIESGDGGQLMNMNKRCSVEDNAMALDNCRKQKVTSIVSLVVGYPGETAETIDRTFEFLRQHPADFFFAATFSTRVAGVPVLNELNRKKYGLRTSSSPYTVAPYWLHDTMTCSLAADYARRLTRRLMNDKVSLNATLFYQNILAYDVGLRNDLLDLQERAYKDSASVTGFLDKTHRLIDHRIHAQMRKTPALNRDLSPSKSSVLLT
jgi:anaerobic magnesium-protoporphyrin IX monomethyl ester cyclase